jgi:hypothetical protein
MYHLLLANISLTNLLVCTIVKPITGIYVAYAYARVQQCFINTVLSHLAYIQYCISFLFSLTF